MGCLFVVFLLIKFWPVTLILIGIIIWLLSSSGSSSGSGSYSSGYYPSYSSRGYDDDCYCYPEDNDYYTDDYNHNYNSYYAQLSDEAMAGDVDAVEEMREEFGDDWEGRYS